MGLLRNGLLTIAALLLAGTAATPPALADGFEPITVTAVGTPLGDGGRWVAYAVAARKLRVIDEAAGTVRDHAIPCVIGVQSNPLLAVGGGQAVVGCRRAGRLVSRPLLLDLRSGNWHTVPGIDELLASLTVGRHRQLAYRRADVALSAGLLAAAGVADLGELAAHDEIALPLRPEQLRVDDPAGRAADLRQRRASGRRARGRRQARRHGADRRGRVAVGRRLDREADRQRCGPPFAAARRPPARRSRCSSRPELVSFAGASATAPGMRRAEPRAHGASARRARCAERGC
jgi:hypothetical protein